jgi:AcrR family transcriptional regulator
MIETRREMVAKAPVQERSQQTYSAILDAVEALLHDRPFDQITTTEIAQEAGLTTGAIYGRFRSKDDLLPHLYVRYLDWVDQEVPIWFAKHDWAALDPAQSSDLVAEKIIRLHQTKPWLLRAVIIYVRGKRRSQARGARDHSNLVESILKCFHHCKGVSPVAEADLVFAVHAALTIAREILIFPDAPMARAVYKNKAELTRQISGLLQAAFK